MCAYVPDTKLNAWMNLKKPLHIFRAVLEQTPGVGGHDTTTAPSGGGENIVIYKNYQNLIRINIFRGH